MTLTIPSKEGVLITLRIVKSNSRTDGFWDIDRNLLLLGYDRYEEFNDMWGDIQRQSKFIDQLTKVSKNALK